MAGALLLLMGAGGNVISVTVGTASAGGGKTPVSSQYGYANAANSLSGSIIGSRTPTTLLSATINAIYFEDDSTTGNFYLVLNGNQTALTITHAIINGTTYNLTLVGFSGGQTTWHVVAAVGNNWGGSPANAVFT